MKYGIFLLWLFYFNYCHAQNGLSLQAHAHNDYTHKRPLLDALDNGFTSIEIDVFLHNNELKVAHTGVGLDNKPNIESLYLEPIKKIIAQNGGRVYKAQNTPVILMIDFKTSASETYNKLKEILYTYRELLTVYKNGAVIHQGPLQILISGSKPFKDVMAEDTSFVTIDADIKAVDQNKHDKVITRYSDPWGNYFTWKGIGAMPKAEKEQLEELIKKVHAKGKHIRFYHIPDKPNVWKFLLDEGVDWINTDKLAAYSKFYNNRIKNIPKLAGN